MRKLVVMRGHQGSGKSYTINEAGLRQWTLSPDDLRMVLSPPVLGTDGRMMNNQGMNDRVFAFMNKLVHERMDRGETLVIDYTMQSIGDLKNWVSLADQYRYQLAFVDMSNIDLNLALARQKERHEFHKVPEHSVTKFHDVIKANPIPESENYTIIKGKPDGSHIEELKNWLKEPVYDLSSYERIVHIGDLQGCHSVVVGPDGPLADGFRDDTFYIFVGDLLDRGIENGKVLRWFLEEAVPRDNVVLLYGNHEKHLHLWSKGQPSVSPEFETGTLPQLLEEGLTPEDADAVMKKARDYFLYTYNGEQVFVNHAGVSTYPERPELISLEQYSKGTGFWTDPVDEQFQRNTEVKGLPVIQVHGHRNHGNVDIRATEKSFNLEDSVEFGGSLRTCTLSADGWGVNAYRNPVYAPLRDRLQKDSYAVTKEKKMYPDWVLNEEDISTTFDLDLLQQMRDHTGIREKNSERFPHVSSLNFTRKVFYERSWDDVVVKARGMFLNTATKEIVSRGYEKFWNVNEREETQVHNLVKNLKMPVTLYVKENGFLGNIGYDRETDSLFVASKSTPDGTFADIFREILDQTLTAQQQERLRRYLRDTDSCMTFEVIDPVRDPHMIEYEAPKLVLLDILCRTTDFRKADYETLKKVGEKMGFEVKEKAITFTTPQAFSGWFKKASKDLNCKFGGKHLEGFVVEDSDGYMTKVKLPYYSFWKQMRSMKDKIVSVREKGGEFSYEHTRAADGSTPSEAEVTMANSFRDWALEQDSETLKADIITLRKQFGYDFGNEPPVSQTKMSI